MNEIKSKNCVVCGKEFYYKTKAKKASGRFITYRGRKAVTCSKKCSKIYPKNKKLFTKLYKNI